MHTTVSHGAVRGAVSNRRKSDIVRSHFFDFLFASKTLRPIVGRGATRRSKRRDGVFATKKVVKQLSDGDVQRSAARQSS